METRIEKRRDFLFIKFNLISFQRIRSKQNPQRLSLSLSFSFLVNLLGNKAAKSHNPSNLESWFRWNTCLSRHFTWRYQAEITQVNNKSLFLWWKTRKTFDQTSTASFSLIRFSVYDEDSVGSDFLGEYRLKLSTIRPDVKEAYAVFLQNKTDVSRTINSNIEITRNNKRKGVQPTGKTSTNRFLFFS